MSTPLSPLRSSGQNSRLGSPKSSKSPRFTKGQGSIDEMMAANDYPENIYSSPFKEVVEDADPTPAQSHSDDENDDKSFQEAPSSPFQPDGRDDTVDFQRLQEMQAQAQAQTQRRASSLAPSEHSTTPQKRSYEHVPGEQDELDSDDSEGPCKKGANRRPESDIDVYTDANTSFQSDRTEGAAQQEAGSTSMMEEKYNEGMSTVLQGDNASDDKENNADDGSIIDDSHDSMDETGLSTFSAVPDMTTFAKLGESPTKAMQSLTPKSAAPAVERQGTPSSARTSNRRSGSIDMGTPVASPRRREYRDSKDTTATPNLLDFNDHPAFSPRPRYSMQNARHSPTKPSPLKLARESIHSPSKMPLLDYDIPPPPTPRSIPTVTPRELESVKSSFMSEISSLKATLSGREAEVSSLKQAVADAERRVGEAMEEIRNEAARKDSLEMEQAEWQRRGEEMENILREVRADIMEGEQEKTRLITKVEEAYKSKEQLESRMVELESQLTVARNAASDAVSKDTGSSTTTTQSKTTNDTAREVQEAVEKVARELHTLYKGKHETKVAALKKSYESRWEKRIREAENKLKDAQEENNRMKEERKNAATSETNKDHEEISGMMARARDEHEAEKRVSEAEIKGLQQKMAALREDRERLQSDLESERAEKGELVAVVDEWLAMQQQQPPQLDQPSRRSSPNPVPSASPEPSRMPSAEPAMEDFLRSVSHGSASGNRPPETGSGGDNKERKIPKVSGARVARGNSNAGKSGIATSTPGRSGIMGSIERMGRKG